MASNPGGPNSSLVERVKRILLEPKAEWPRIDAEPATIADIYKRYVLILAAIGPIARLIGEQLFGYRMLGVAYKPALTASLTSAVIGYVMALVSIYVLALIIDALATSFGGTKDQVKAFKVAAYSWTAAWLVGIFWIIPQLAILGILGLYSLYLLYLGLPVLMRVPQDKAVGYVVVTVIAGIVIFFVVGIVVAALTGAITPPVAPSGTITYTVPG